MESIDDTKAVGEDANAFARSGRVARSPVTPLDTVASTSQVHSEPQATQQERTLLNRVFTPNSSSSTTHNESRLEKSSLADIRRKVNELYEFVKERNNVHLKIKHMVTSIRSAVSAAEREQNALRMRAETAEKALTEAAERPTTDVQETPRSHQNTRSEKRFRESPGEQEDAKKHKNEKKGVNNQRDAGSEGEWRIVGSQQKKKKNRKVKEGKKPEQKKKETRQPPRLRYKGDALVVEANDKTTYAALLKRVKEDPELKELGENVVKTRRTQKGDMIFVLKKDPSVKSTAYKELIAKSLGDEANVRALSQEAVVECRDLDEITTEEDLKWALAEQCNLEGQMSMRIRKSYGGTQTAAIRLPVDAANKLVALGTIKVGWSVCPLRLVPRVAKQMERCFKCRGFGHQSRNCKGPDRSDLCWNCGGNGHVARDCTKRTRCLLCMPEDGNDHPTGGFKCPAYKKAKAGQ